MTTLTHDFHDGRGPVPAHQHLYGGGWVADSAHVDASVRVTGDALVYGNARVTGDAQVYGNAQVSGDAQVSGNAQVTGNALVESQADFLIVGPVGSRGDYLMMVRDSKLGIRVSTGCFSGSWAEFCARVDATYPDATKGHGRSNRLLAAGMYATLSQRIKDQT